MAIPTSSAAPPFDAYRRRRLALIERMAKGGGGIALIPTSPERTRNRDTHYPYRADSYFQYLTGFAEPEAVLAIVRGLPRFDGRAAFSTWSYRVATNACLDELRRRRRRPVADGSFDDEDRGPTAVDRRSSTFDDGVATRLEVDAALAELAPEFRAAVVLRDLCALDYAEIADVLEIPPGTVRSRIARGRAQLADRLGNQTDPTERPTPAP